MSAAERYDKLAEEGEKAATFRPPLATTGDEYAALVEKKDREISALRQELETERREIGRLRTRLEEVGKNG